MKKLLLILLVLCPYILNGQSNTTIKFVHGSPALVGVASLSDFNMAAYKIDTIITLKTGLEIGRIPNQTLFVGNMYFGTTADSLRHTSETEAGDYNTYYGFLSGGHNKQAKLNTGFGYGALANTESGWNNTAVGYKALYTGIGTGSLTVSGSGGEFYANTAVGANSQPSSTTASYNTSIGVASLFSLVSGHNNTAIGVHAINNNVIGNGNTVIGRSAGYALLTSYNVAIGCNSLLMAYKGINTAIGTDAMMNDTSGVENTAIGYRSQLNLRSGYGNTSVGYESGRNNITGNGNTSFGYKALYSNLGSHNIGLGYQAGDNITNGDYNIIIGDYVDASSATGSYQLNIGNLITGSMATATKKITFAGALAMIPSDTTPIVAATGVTAAMAYNPTLKVIGAAGAACDITANPQIADGTAGQILILHGSDDTKTVKFDDGTGLATNGNASRTLGKGDKLVLQYDATDDTWYELFYSDN